MTVLITGGSGFIGLNIIEQFITERSVVAIDENQLPHQAQKKFKKNNFQFIRTSIKNKEKIASIIKDYSITIIIHGAALAPGKLSEHINIKETMDINLMGTIDMLELAKQYNIKKFIYLSSASVYGNKESNLPNDFLEEETIPLPKTIYAISKYGGETVALRYKKLFKMNVTVARIGIVFGPWEYDTGARETLSAPFVTTKLAIRKIKAFIPNYGNRDWLYSRDVGRALLSIVNHSRLTYDIYNISYNSKWSIKEWCEKLTKQYPGFEFEIVKALEDANVSLHSKTDRPSLSIQRLEKDIGFIPKYGLDEAFSDYVTWIESYS